MFQNVEKGNLLILDPGSVTEHDIEMMAALDVHPPESEYKPGDLLKLRLDQLPAYIPARFGGAPNQVPLVWKVRFVISKWAFQVMSLLESSGAQQFVGIDNMIASVERTKLSPHEYTKAILYVHAFPHGLNPDSALFIEERNRKGIRTTERFYVREEVPQWPVVLDEARARYIGFDPSESRSSFSWNLAPDLYRDGENIGKPFVHEYATVDTMANNGLERLLFDPRIRSERTPIDPEHPLLVKRGADD